MLRLDLWIKVKFRSREWELRVEVKVRGQGLVLSRAWLTQSLVIMILGAFKSVLNEFVILSTLERG